VTSSGVTAKIRLKHNFKNFIVLNKRTQAIHTDFLVIYCQLIAAEVANFFQVSYQLMG
jgi:hypothetical protein